MFAWLRHNCSPLSPSLCDNFFPHSCDVLYHDNRRRQTRRNRRRPGKKASSLTTIPEAETLVESVWLAGGKSKFIILLWGVNHCGAPLEREINKEKSATIFLPLSLFHFIELKSAGKAFIMQKKNRREFSFLSRARLSLAWSWSPFVVVEMVSCCCPSVHSKKIEILPGTTTGLKWHFVLAWSSFCQRETLWFRVKLLLLYVQEISKVVWRSQLSSIMWSKMIVSMKTWDFVIQPLRVFSNNPEIHWACIPAPSEFLHR